MGLTMQWLAALHAQHVAAVVHNKQSAMAEHPRGVASRLCAPRAVA